MWSNDDGYCHFPVLEIVLLMKYVCLGSNTNRSLKQSASAQNLSNLFYRCDYATE